MPSVSIVLPVYNGGLYLSEALDSIEAQTFANFELILINSASTDETQKMIDERGDRRYKVVSLPVKCGVATPRNLGIQMAEGDYIATMDADDVMAPFRIAAQVNFLTENTGVDILGSQFTLIEGSNSSRRTQPLKDDVIKAKLLWVNGNAIHNPTTMIRRDFLLRKHLFYPPFPVDSDHGLWVSSLAAGATFANLEEDLLIYRRHPANLSRTRNSVTENTKWRLRVELLGMFFPDIELREARFIAGIMGNTGVLALEELFGGLQAINKVLRLSQCGYGASLEEIRKILFYFRGECMQAIDQRMKSSPAKGE
jgi:glycosyltransferase involved in cell wall biosynthesis